MVLDIGKLLGGDFDYVERDIKAVADVTHKSGAILKVILENAYLTEDLIAQACKICEKADADFVKTSTGYAPSGATIPHLRLMRESVSDKVQVKAAGGVRTLDAALNVRAVGTTRFGCTATAKIMDDAREREAAGTLKLPENVGDELQGGY
jgi:deoxyribose-phosphate aldolase